MQLNHRTKRLFKYLQCSFDAACLLFSGNRDSIRINGTRYGQLMACSDAQAMLGTKSVVFYDEPVANKFAVKKWSEVFRVNQGAWLLWRLSEKLGWPKIRVEKLTEENGFSHFRPSESKAFIEFSEELELNNDEPYIKIQTINSKNSFIANRAKTFKEEKNVANKAPVENITIKNIGINNLENKKKSVKFLSSDSIFLYVIKIADFYFRDSADMLINRLSGDHNIQEIKIKKLSKNSYRVYTGPFKNLDSLKKAYNNIMKLNFENIEIIKL